MKILEPIGIQPFRRRARQHLTRRRGVRQAAFLRNGPKALTDAELVAILLKNGRPGASVAEVETDDPTMRGEMTITFSLAPMPTAAPRSLASMTACRPVCRPPTTRPGWRESLAKLAAFVEAEL